MAGYLDTWDFVAIGCYFAAVLATGLYSMCRSNRGTVAGYFLAGRYMIWLPVGASIFASNIGSEHFIGLAGSGAAAGIGVGAFELNASILLQLLGWVFLPVYIASGVCTLPEFMMKRYGGRRIQIYLTVLSLVLYIFTKISVNFFAGAIFIQQALHWNLYISVILILAATALCTVTGGLAAVIYTDTLQAFVMVIGTVILGVIGFIKVGGYKELVVRYMEAIPNSTLTNPNTTCGYPREDSWILLRNPVDSDMPWPAFLLGQTPASIWYWCADQMMVQRALAAKSLSHAQGGTLFAGAIKLLPLFVMVMPGMISRVLYTEEVACADPDICEAVCGNRIGCSNIAYPKLVLELMPSGLKGLMMSVMLAALMSDLTSIFNSASTLFTMDIYRYIRKKPSTRELMIVGRAFVLVMVVIGVVWIPVIQTMQGGQLYIYIQAISAYLAPPIAAMYLISLLWKRANEQGAFWGLMAGAVVGITRMVLDFVFTEPECGEPDMRPTILSRMHYMYFAMLLFNLTGIVMIIVSLCTKPPTEERLIRTTYWTRYDQRVRKDDIDIFEDHNAKELQELSQVLPTGKEAEHKDKNGYHGELQHGIFKEDQDKLMSGGDAAVVCTTDVPVQVQEPHDVPWWKRGYNWFCGFDDTAQGARNKEAQEAHLRKITSLKQDPRARMGLNILLVLLISTGTFCYVFFSTGHFGLLD